MFRMASAFICVGVAILLFAFWMWSRDQNSNTSTQMIGRVIRDTGDLKIQHAGQRAHPQTVSQMEPLLAGDELETNQFGEASIQLDNGLRFRLLAGSYVSFPANSKHPGLLIKRGRLDFANSDVNIPLDISAEGKMLSISDYQKMVAATGQPGSPFGNSPPSNVPSSPQKNILTEAEIQQTLGQYKSLFFHCYAQAVQKSPAVKGHANLIFTLENNGKVKFAEVNQSEIDDPQFKSCLAEAVKRIPFRDAPADSITFNYPLDFQ